MTTCIDNTPATSSTDLCFECLKPINAATMPSLGDHCPTCASDRLQRPTEWKCIDLLRDVIRGLDGDDEAQDLLCNTIDAIREGRITA